MRKIAKLLFCSLLCIIGVLETADIKANNPKNKVYLVSNAHLDTQWNWDVQTTIKEYIWNTLNQNLFLLKKYPNYVFNFEGGVKYAWMKEYYPEQYESLKDYIKQGRWHVTGSSWDANDVLISSSESVIRNILHGQVYYRSEFGVEGTDIFLPDCFGFGWTLPSLAAHCGLIGFSSQKLAWRNRPFHEDRKYPFSVGLWEGIDGNKIMMAHGFNYGKRWDNEELSNNKELKKLTDESPINTIYHYYGVGDIGGSPTLGSVLSVEAGVKGDGPVEIISATSDQLYKDYLPFENHPELPNYNGELLMDVHGTGCYTSQGAMKLYNRQNEQLGDAAERAAVVAEWLNNTPYPSTILADSWKRFIYHQFHDDLTGTSIPRAYEFSWNDEFLSLKQFSDVISSSVTAVAKELDTRGKGLPVVLYNPNGFESSSIAEIEIELDKEAKGISVYNEEGKKAESQLVKYEKGKAHLLVAAKVPANGYVVYEVRLNGSHSNFEPIASSSIENSVYKIELNNNGDISSILDKRYSRELVKAGKSVRLALFTENKSYHWPAWEILKEIIDQDPISVSENVKTTLIEDGELRKVLCVEKEHDKSVFKQYILLYEHYNSDRIDIYNEVEWNSTNTLLKAEFPLSINNDIASYDLGLGSVERSTNTDIVYEVYAHKWVDLTDNSDEYGVSIMNDCKYGWDKPNDHTMRLTLLHTPSTKRNYAYQNQQDLGYHEFTYSLIGHSGKLNKAKVSERAEQFNQPLISFVASKHFGKLGKSFSFAHSDNDRVLIKAIKKAEVSDEYVVRLYETEGKTNQSANISFAGKIIQAYEADGTEKTIGDASFNKNKLNVAIPPFGVKTFKVKLEESDLIKKSKVLHRHLDLDFNIKCFSWNELRHEANFESGNSYAAELLPETLITADNVSFKFGKTDLHNGLECKGNIIELPHEQRYNRIHILAASKDKDRDATFYVGTQKEEFNIPYYSDFIGQWGQKGYTEGFLKQANVAYIGTHSHSVDRDEIYNFNYMFKLDMDIPEGSKSITLPVDSNIVVFAITLTYEEYPALIQASKLYKTSIDDAVAEEVSKVNIIANKKAIQVSGEVNKNESADNATDGDITTKWCDTSKGPHFIDFDLGSPQLINGWKLVSAGLESSSYITKSCFLQGKRNSLDEEWETIDAVTGNRNNVINKHLKSVEYRYIRLLITQPTQGKNWGASRIYEFEVYSPQN